MKEIKKVLVLGVGAIGSIYATKIYDVDKNSIKVLLDDNRFEKYKHDGVIFNDKKYDFDYVLENNQEYKPDLILIATKATDFENASNMINNFVGENTVILSLLNGISSEKTLIKKYGKEKVLYSYYIGHASEKHGNKINYDGVGKIVFGADSDIYLEEVLRVKEFFDKVGVSYEVPENIISSMWQKFVINIGINQTLAVVNSPYSTLQKSNYVRKIALDLMQEAVNVAESIGISGSENFIKTALELIDSMPPELKPSMLQDVENNKPTEVDIFAGEICILGKQYGVLTPKNELIFNLIKAIDEKI